MMFLTVVLVLSAAAILALANVSTARANARLLRLVERDSKLTSVSRPKNTTRCLNTKGELAEFVTDLRNLANVSPLIMTIRPDRFEGCSVSCVTNEYWEPGLQACLSRRLLTSLTPLEWQFWENELRRVGRESGGVLYEERGW